MTSPVVNSTVAFPDLMPARRIPTLTTVLPATALPASIRLTNCDVTTAKAYIRAIAFFQVGGVGCTSFDKVEDALRTAFSEVVSACPMVAGQLQEVGKSGDYEVCASTVGAHLVLQNMDDVTVAKLQSCGFSNASMPTGLVAESPYPQEGDPLLRAVVTRLPDGVCIGVAIHHYLADGGAACALMLHWAALTRCALGIMSTGSVSLPPLVCDRTGIALLADGSGATRPHPELRVSDASSTGALSALAASFLDSTNEYFRFDAAALHRLKTDALNSLSPVPLGTTTTSPTGRTMSIGVGTTTAKEWVTTADALCALMWRAVTRSRFVHPEESTICSVAVEIRGRMHPPLPPAYFGNATYFSLSHQTVSGVVGASLGDVARAVRTSIDAVDSDHVKSAMEFIEAVGDKARVGKAVRVSEGNDFGITNWCKFPLPSLDFGFGTPVAVRVPPMAFDGACIAIPQPHGVVDVYVGIATCIWDRLVADEELARYGVPLV